MKFPIFLIGLMGAGKTTLGKQLAHLLHVEFLDTDEQIEQQVGMNVEQVFSELGETYFRKLEKEMAFSFHPGERMVVSTGGGFPCQAEVLDHMKSIGTLIYLEISQAILANRLVHEKDKRPLLKRVESQKEMIEILNLQLANREKFYQCADFIVPADATIDEVLKRITLILN
jgi:shikimate kinase